MSEREAAGYIARALARLIRELAEREEARLGIDRKTMLDEPEKQRTDPVDS